MIDEIRTFLDVAHANSFSAVARKHNVAVSSVTRKVDALEAQLGVKLFLRSSRHIQLSDAGEQFIQSARHIVQELDDAVGALGESQQEPQGVLSVTAPTAFGQRHLVPAALSFMQRYPKIELELHLTDQWIDLAAQRVDVALRVGKLPDSDLLATRIAPMRRLVCASPSYIQAHGCPDTALDLLQHRCLTVLTKPAPVGLWCFPGIQGGRALPVRGPMRASDIGALMLAAANGLGIVHLPSYLVFDLLQAGQLVQLFPESMAQTDSAQSAIHAVRLPGRSHAAKAQLFIAHLKQAFGEPAYWDVAQDKKTVGKGVAASTPA